MKSKRMYIVLLLVAIIDSALFAQGPIRVSQTLAREIMGSKNVFGIEENIEYFRVYPTYWQLIDLLDIPYSKEVLEQLKDSCVLTAVLPLSIFEICKVAPELFEIRDWENKMEKGDNASWQLVYKNPVKDSLVTKGSVTMRLKDWRERQIAILSTNDNNNEMPTAQIMVYTIVGHYLATGERLFGHTWAYTSSIGAGIQLMYVGYAGDRIISVDWRGDCWGCLGISYARKSQFR